MLGIKFSVLPKLQLKAVLVFLPNLQFAGVSRANLRRKKPDVFTLQFCVLSQNENPRRDGPIVQNLI